jgi:hypothetical protein
VSTKVTVNLPDDAVADIRAAAKRNGTTMTQAIRDAITVYAWIESEIEEGGVILLEKDGRTNEIVFGGWAGLRGRRRR